MGVWELAPRKIFRATPTRTLENALLQQEIKLLLSLMSVLRRKTDRLIRKRKTNKLNSPFLSASYACSPMQEAKI